MQNKIQILATGPLEETLKSAALEKNFLIDEISFIDIEEVVGDARQQRIRELSAQKASVVFTSRNTVTIVKKFITRKPDWKIFCVGNATQKLVNQFFGESSIVAVADYGEDLAQKIIDSSPGNIIFFCGNRRRDELPDTLKKNKIDVDEIVVYHTIETSKLISKNYEGILFFSPSAVESFFSINSVTHQTSLFAIGNTTASAIKSFTNLPVLIPQKPGKENLVNLAIHHFSKSKIE